jgi:hypothetical protein
MIVLDWPPTNEVQVHARNTVNATMSERVDWFVEAQNHPDRLMMPELRFTST